ncbi:MAG: hypothetical protein Kow0047_02200 [Anaerolineae bacterium]
MRYKHARAQSVVEFALILPALALFMMTVIDLGRGIYAYTVLTAAAQAGARYAAVHPGDTSGTAQAVNAEIVGLVPAQVNTQVSWDSDSTATVTVSYGFFVLTPILQNAVGNGGIINLSATASMRAY